ncbi:DDE family transposase [Streptomyces sp. KS 21]|nr:DDE family transposase [Streptomyces sp. KS 21]
MVSQAGAALLIETVHKSGLDGAISAALAPWRKSRAVHDPGKILLDVTLATALGDCLADAAMLRAEPEVFGPVASDPTISRLIGVLAASGPKALTAIRSARAEVRQPVWELAGANSPAADGQVTVDLDGVLVLAHSEKQDTTATWKKTFGHHPLVAFVDHGPDGSGEPVAALLRPGNAGSNTASDHSETTRLALAQLPTHLRRGRQTLIRTDSAGGTHAFLDWLTKPGRWLSYSVGMTITDAIHQAVLKIPKRAWTPAYDAGATERPGARVAEITDVPDLTTWPKGMRLIVRKERPHPGVQLHFTDLDGLRLTCFATNPKAASSPTSNCVTAAGHAARTASETPATPAPAQPAPARQCPEPDLAGDRPARPRPAGLDADARTDRRHPPLGTQTASPTPVLRRRTSREHRPPALAPLHRPMPLDRRHHSGIQTTPSPTEPLLTIHFDRPDNPHRHRRVEPGAHPARQPGPHPAPPPESRHPAQAKSPSANRRGPMNGRG